MGDVDYQNYDTDTADDLDELGVATVLTPHHCWKDARIQELEEENTDLHLVAQGIKHYWLCPHNIAAGNPNLPHVCVRCERDRALAGEEHVAGSDKMPTGDGKREPWTPEQTVGYVEKTWPGLLSRLAGEEGGRK